MQDTVHRDRVVEFGKDRPVRFAERNNCVGGFHRNPILLRQMFDKHPQKMQWFADNENGSKGQWRSDMTYQQIAKHRLQYELGLDDFSECDSGHCGL